MNAKSETTTLTLSGTRISLPPIKAKQVIVVSFSVSSASLRSTLEPPMMLMTFRCRPTRQRPLRSWPLITDTTHSDPPPPGLHRHPRLHPLGVAGHDDIGRQLVELPLGSSLVDEIQPLVEFVHGEPTLARRVPEQVGGVFTVGIGGAELGKRVVGHYSQPTVSTVRNAVHSLEPDL